VSERVSYRTVHQDAVHAAGYDQLFHSSRSVHSVNWNLEQRLLDRIFAGELARPPRVAVDFACGTGRILRYLESRVDLTVGIDVSAEMLAHAKARCRRSLLIEHDVTRAPLRDLPGPVDLITAFRFFLNAEPELRREALAWMRSVLTPGGALVANFHLNPRSLRGTYLRARWAGERRAPMLAPAQAARLLQAGGFHVQARYGYEYLPYRRSGDRALAVGARARLETALLHRARLARFGGAFLLVARPR
jgi:SAM-dependent methyltransferase